jgi:hypothetical protein
MKILISVLTLALSGVCSSAIAQWQWLDNDGRKVFSDRAPPPEVPEKSILKRPNSAPKAAAIPAAANEGSGNTAAAPVPVLTHPAGGGVDKDLEAKKKQATDAEAAKHKAEEDKLIKARIENCARAKQAKASFDSGVRIARTNAAGEREVLEDAARAAELKRIQGIVESECR